jgi:hypothetical protein
MGVVAIIVVVALLAAVTGLDNWYWLGAAVVGLIVVLLIGRRPRARHAVAAEPDGFRRLVALCHGESQHG